MIHREGFGTLALIGGLVLAISGTTYYFNLGWVQYPIYIICFGFFLFILQFFRNPKRHAPNIPNGLISPADGKVVVITTVHEKRFFKKEMQMVSIFMSPFNVHVNRVPFNGKVVHSEYHKGKYLVAFHPKSSDLNESTTVVFEHNNGQQVMVRQIAGAVARRIICYMKKDQQVEVGSEMGFIKFGSRADIYLPLDADIKVKLGDKTVGAETLIAELK